MKTTLGATEARAIVLKGLKNFGLGDDIFGQLVIIDIDVINSSIMLSVKLDGEFHFYYQIPHKLKWIDSCNLESIAPIIREWAIGKAIEFTEESGGLDVDRVLYPYTPVLTIKRMTIFHERFLFWKASSKDFELSANFFTDYLGRADFSCYDELLVNDNNLFVHIDKIVTDRGHNGRRLEGFVQRDKTKATLIWHSKPNLDNVDFKELFFGLPATNIGIEIDHCRK